MPTRRRRTTTRTYAYESLQDWLREPENTQTKLRKLLLQREGIRVGKPHISSVVNGRWGLSLTLAAAISRITHVPVENLVFRAPVKQRQTSKKVA